MADDHVVRSGGGEHYFTVGAGAGKFGVALADFFVFISELACVMCLLLPVGNFHGKVIPHLRRQGIEGGGAPGTLQYASWPASCRA